VAPAPGFEVLIGRLAVAVHEAAGDVRGGLEAAEIALERSGRRRVCEAEFRRVRADCLLMLGRREEAAAELDRALQVARSQGARSLEERVLGSMRNARGTVGVAR
jgi:predicted RNA polymerase sigma factor